MHNKEPMPFEDAKAEAWLKPDIMEAFILEMKAAREEQFAEIEIAKSKGLGTDWLLGKMLAYSRIVEVFEQSET
jgi:hypothetical protein